MKTYKQFVAEAKTQKKPRVFYRGEEPESNEKKIFTHNSDWDQHFFVSSDKRQAANYGSRIHEYHAEPDAKILYHGTKEYRTLVKGIKHKNIIDHSAEVARRAKVAGYHAVHFQQQGNQGTTVFDKSKFKKVAEYDRNEKNRD